jgi:tRNA pseudouridine38-40 synthase
MEYDGTRYHGSQFQTNAPSIQGETESALHKLTGEEIRISMASRTDAGVHAKGQVVGFRTQASFPPKTWVEAMNHYLPKDISIRAAYEVDGGFDVRRHALCRDYRYHILNRRTPSPLWRHFSEFVPQSLDVEAMNSACAFLVGERDFAPFAPATYTRSTRRRVFRAEVSRRRGMVLFDMQATSFLPHQVRNTVGGLVKVGLHKMTVETFREKASSGRAGMIGPTAPARGLCLVNIKYPDFPPSEEIS